MIAQGDKAANDTQSVGSSPAFFLPLPKSEKKNKGRRGNQPGCPQIPITAGVGRDVDALVSLCLYDLQVHQARPYGESLQYLASTVQRKRKVFFFFTLVWGAGRDFAALGKAALVRELNIKKSKAGND